jgi:hypothetical protein
MQVETVVKKDPILYLSQDSLDSVEVHELDGNCNCMYCKQRIRLIVTEQ